MAYDFDWAGETIELGDEEAETFVLPLEPGVNAQGIDSPGSLAGYTEFTNHGVWNGAFRVGPPDPTASITPASSTSASNFMPHWRFVQSSNTAITASQVRDTASPSGSNLRFTFASGAAADAAYIEQVIDIGGNRLGQVGDILRATGVKPTGTGQAARIRAQYLTVDGTIAGMPAEQVSGGFATTTSPTFQYLEAYGSAAPPGNARYLRLRIEAYRASGTGTGTVDIIDVRRDQARTLLPVADLGSSSNPPDYLFKDSGRTKLRSQEVASNLLLGYKLVPVFLVGVNIPAGATTNLELSDNAMGMGGSARIPIPWAGSVVGCSYRWSGATTGAVFDIDVLVAGSSVWTPFSGEAIGSTQSTATQNVNTDAFTAGQTIGAQVTTNPGFGATLELVVVVWLAVNWGG